MTPMFRILKFISHIDRLADDRTHRPVSGLLVHTTDDIKNDYGCGEDVIPAGTPLLCDFGGDFGLYATADVEGVLVRAKVSLHELHKVDFSAHSELIDKVLSQ